MKLLSKLRRELLPHPNDQRDDTHIEWIYRLQAARHVMLGHSVLFNCRILSADSSEFGKAAITQRNPFGKIFIGSNDFIGHVSFSPYGAQLSDQRDAG